MDIKYEVENLVKKYKTNNPFQLIYDLDIILYHTYLKHNTKGCYTKKFGERLIIINKNLCYEEQRMVAAHELAHAILHTDVNILALSTNSDWHKSRYEREANIFAAELLISDDIFTIYEGYSIDYISKTEGISVELLEYKYKNFLKNM